MALARGGPGLALELADELIDQTVQREGPPRVVPRLLKLRGHALVALGRFEDGVLALQQARDIAAEITARPLLWRIDAALGRVFTLLRQTTQAQQCFTAARACVEELADAIADASLRAVFLAEWPPSYHPRGRSRPDARPGSSLAALRTANVTWLR